MRLNDCILGFLHPFSTRFMHIHPFCGSIEDHEEKDTDKSIIWAKWVLKKGCCCGKESQNGQFVSKFYILATRTMEYQPKTIAPGLFHIPEDG
jgi:hypothetical protein